MLLIKSMLLRELGISELEFKQLEAIGLFAKNKKYDTDYARHLLLKLKNPSDPFEVEPEELITSAPNILTPEDKINDIIEANNIKSDILKTRIAIAKERYNQDEAMYTHKDNIKRVSIETDLMLTTLLHRIIRDIKSIKKPQTQNELTLTLDQIYKTNIDHSHTLDQIDTPSKYKLYDLLFLIKDQKCS